MTKTDTGWEIEVIPWLASYEISKPEVNKTVSNTQLSRETDAFMTAIETVINTLTYSKYL